MFQAIFRKLGLMQAPALLSLFKDFSEKQFKDGVIGQSRYAHSLVIYKSLKRFLTIKKMVGISAEDFTPDLLMEYRDYLFDEYLYVKMYPELFCGMKRTNIPRKRRASNTVVTVLNRMQAFYTELEEKDMVQKNPFRKLGKERRKVVMRERYDDPIFLTRKEFLQLRQMELPDRFTQCRNTFLLQSALGCRIGDFLLLTMDNVAVSPEGIPYVHYLPSKTMNSQAGFKEVVTPLVRFAFDIIKETGGFFPEPRQASFVVLYNKRIKEMLEYCGINRKCTVYNEVEKKNKYIPLYELASSKLCRKTHVDFMNKVQVDRYAAGLHKEGSDAVNRYTLLELKDRFILMCAAFGEKPYKVDDELNMVEE